MDIAANLATTAVMKEKNLHPITIITLLDKNQQSVACKAVFDQCCTNSGLITWELPNRLGLPTTSGESRSFVTAARTFVTNDTLKTSDAMLPCLSSNRTFTIELMVIPKQCSADINYGVIIGQESMRLLDLDTSVRDNTISLGDQSISMVPQDYWTAKRIQRQKNRLNRHNNNHESKSNQIEEADSAEALTPTNYVNANLPEIAKNCKNLSSEQQKLLVVLTKHQSLFLGKHGEWMDKLVSIETVEGATPVWAKPYPVPLKNREVFQQEVQRQCTIGALHELSADEIEERVLASPCFGVPKKNGTI